MPFFSYKYSSPCVVVFSLVPKLKHNFDNQKGDVIYGYNEWLLCQTSELKICPDVSASFTMILVL